MGWVHISSARNQWWKLQFLCISGPVQMCTCRLSLSYLSWGKHANLKSQIPSVRGALQTCWVCNLLRRLETRVKLFFFVNSKLFLPKKSSKLEMYLILPNFLTLMYVRRVTWCECFPLICIVCAFVALHEFTTVRCYGAKKRGTTNCVRFRSTCSNNNRCRI